MWKGEELGMSSAHSKIARKLLFRRRVSDSLRRHNPGGTGLEVRAHLPFYGAH